MNVNIEASWQKVLCSEFDKEYFKHLTDFIRSEYATKTVYPKASKIFNAFNLTPFDKVKVVIIGQDPYHEPGQAHGLSFSVLAPTPPPPSLINIYKEIKADTGKDSITQGDLTPWAQQGVLLLNATLTVLAHKALSHSGKGWEEFTDSVIHALAEQRENLVFILWGSYAQKKGSFIDRQKHLVLQSAHPSPLSAYRGFFGNHQFSQTNQYLISKGLQPIEW